MQSFQSLWAAELRHTQKIFKPLCGVAHTHTCISHMVNASFQKEFDSDNVTTWISQRTKECSSIGFPKRSCQLHASPCQNLKNDPSPKILICTNEPMFNVSQCWPREKDLTAVPVSIRGDGIWNSGTFFYLFTSCQLWHWKTLMPLFCWLWEWESCRVITRLMPWPWLDVIHSPIRSSCDHCFFPLRTWWCHFHSFTCIS